jgi:hypothetical protein
MKADVLAAVADRGEADAVEVADALGFTYEAAAMALLRAYRGGLLARTGAPGLQAFRYSLTDKGVQRLEYLAGTQRHAARPRSTPNSSSGESDMRTKRLYFGLYHCPECVYEVTLTSEPSLKCPDCGGRFYEGELPEESDDDDDYDEGDE